MNIESEGENTIVSTKDWEETKTPERKPANNYSFLSLTEKCKAYLGVKEGKTYAVLLKILTGIQKPSVRKQRKVKRENHLKINIPGKDAMQKDPVNWKMIISDSF